MTLSPENGKPIATWEHIQIATNMTNESLTTYPSIAQSWGIAGISILFMILFSPVTIVLNALAVPREISFLLYYVLAMGSTFAFVHLKRKQHTGASDYNFNLSSWKIMILVSIATIALQTGIMSPLVNAVPMPEFIKNIFRELAKQSGVFSFITIVVAAPILEELIFRGIILNGLLKRYSPTRSIVISSILFGAVHLNPWQFIAAFCLGSFSGWVYYKTQKLTLSILIHAVNNSIGFIGMYFMGSESMMDKSLSELYGGVLNLVLTIMGAVAVAAVCITLLISELSKTEVTFNRTEA